MDEDHELWLVNDFKIVVKIIFELFPVLFSCVFAMQ